MKVENKIKQNTKEIVSEIVMRYGTLGGFMLLIIIFSFLSPAFCTMSNLTNLMYRVATLAIVSMGLCCVMITGFLDLSFAGVVTAAGVICTYLMSIGVNMWIAITIGLLAGCIIGAINAFNVLKLGLPDFIATIAMSSIIDGFAYWITQGMGIWEGLNNNFFFIGQTKFGFLPFSAILMLLLGAIYTFITFKTKIGRYIYAIGDNVISAKFSGIHVNKVRFAMFILCGFTAAIGGIIQASCVGQGRPDLGSGLMLDGIAAVFLSMTMFRKGEAHIPGTLIGALLIAVLNNGMTLLNITYYFRDMVKGFIIIAIVIIATVHKRKLQGN